MSVQPNRGKERGAHVLIAIFAISTVVAAFTWLVVRWDARRSTMVEHVFDLINIPATRSLFSVVLLALVTNALLRRKRIGLYAVAFLQVLGIYFSTLSLLRLTHAPFMKALGGYDPGFKAPGYDTTSILLGLAILSVLWWMRSAFPGRLQRGSWLGSLLALLIGSAAAVVATWGLLLIVDEGRGYTHVRQLLACLHRSLGDNDYPGMRSLAGVPVWIPQLTSLLLSATLLVAVGIFLRSARPENRWSGSREISLRSLLARFGEEDSLGYFATRRDKLSIFDADRRAAVTYRVSNGVSLASGDPIGDPAAWSAAINAWKAQARRYGWVPAVLSASERGARSYAAAGLHVLSMGDEAILEPDHFSLDNTSMSQVRHAVLRAQRAGLTVQATRQEHLEPGELKEILACADLWRGEEPDRGFSMALNRPGDPADIHMLFVTARDSHHRLMGVLGFVPWGRAGVSLDVMRRSPLAPNGVTELMVSHLMADAPRLGIKRVSLNFCMFRSVYADAAKFGSGSLTRLNYSVLGSLDRFWQLERLYRANQKFEPQWRPRYLCYETKFALPQVAIAAATCEGFLPRIPLVRKHTEGSLTDHELGLARVVSTTVKVEPTRCRRTRHTQHRLLHLEELARSGREGYPVGEATPTCTIAELAEPLAFTGRRGRGANDAPMEVTVGADPLRLAGRVRSTRSHGGVAFVTLTDAGHDCQLVLDAATLGREQVADFVRVVDSGDLILVHATPGRSRNGTPSLLVSGWQMLAKSLHPVPFAHFTNPEARLRQRSTDLIVHPQQASRLRQRSVVVSSLRDTLREAGFLEVETPILHTIHGGATARPFSTFINAYGMDLSLRIAPELYLKRLVVGGMGPIFEIGRNFRNEGADATHNPEFTSLEAYQPYADYSTMRVLTQRLILDAATALYGRPVVPLGSARLREGGQPRADAWEWTELAQDWPVVPVLQAVSDAVGQTVSLEMDFDELLRLATLHGVAVHPDMGPGALIEELYAELVEPATISPVFYTDFPLETSPLTRSHRSIPGLVERWDLVINGMEIGTAYSELTDPLDQRQRLTDQSLKAAGGDVEAMEVDEDFLHALELGMPPSGGLGLGVDRLVMLLTGTTIRSVLSFPFVKPKRG